MLEIVNSAISPEKWRLAMENDQVMNKIKKHIVQGWPSKCSGLCEDLRDYWKVRNKLNIVGNMVLRNITILSCIVGSEGLRFPGGYGDSMGPCAHTTDTGNKETHGVGRMNPREGV